MHTKIVNNYTKELVCNLIKNSKVRAKILISPISKHIWLVVIDRRTRFTRGDNIDNDKETATTNNETPTAPLYSNDGIIFAVLAVTPTLIPSM